MTSGASYSKKNGSQITLGNQVGNRGGEGTVYAVNGDQNLLAKIYHTGKEKEREAKIAAMIEARLFEKLGFGAFPREQLFSGSNNFLGLSKSSFTGFTMERIENAYPVHQLWNAKDRAKHYPQADFRFLVRAASNLAQNFARLHAEGIVIGDVNESGIWVSNRAYVRLIDCDSFQATLNGKNFPCLVLVEEYTPPELMGKKSALKNRTPNHDNFALAVMIFRLLMAGQHPFNARYTGLGESPTRGRLISEFNYPYARSALGHTFEAPPHAPDVSVFSDEMQAAFEDAFGKSGVQKRPTADKWAELIQRYDDALVMCSRNSAHFHHPQAQSCPLCRVEKKRGEKLFASQKASNPLVRAVYQSSPTAPRKSKKQITIAVALVIGVLALGWNYFQSLEDDRQRALAQAARNRLAAQQAEEKAEVAQNERIAAEARAAELAAREAEANRQPIVHAPIFTADEVDIYVNKKTLEIYILHGKEVRYDIDQFQLDARTARLTVQYNDGSVADLGIKIQCLIYPYMLRGLEISIARTEDRDPIDGTIAPLKIKNHTTTWPFPRTDNQRGRIGFRMQDISEEIRSSVGWRGTGGTLITDVVEGPAQDGGIVAGDIIFSINDRIIESSEEMKGCISLLDNDTRVNLGVFRNGRVLSVPVAILSWEQEDENNLPPTSSSEYTDENAPKTDDEDANDRISTRNPEGWLGVQITNFTDIEGGVAGWQHNYGAVVQEVVADSPAEKAGLLVGDLIYFIGDVRVLSSDELVSFVNQTDPKKRVTVSIFRGEATMALNLTIGQRPEWGRLRVGAE